MQQEITIEYEKVWHTALGELEVMLSKPNFITWFRNTFIFSIDADEVVIGVPNSFTLEWLRNKYQIPITEVLRRLLPDRSLKQIQFKIAQPGRTTPTPLPTPVITIAQTQTKSGALDESLSQSTEPTLPFNPNNTFTNFIVGMHNRLAHAASLAVASDPGKRHNPLFIYGGVGLGKTHLIQAIGNEIVHKYPKKRILYSSCERFANEFIHAIQKKKTDDFKEKYRNVDVLLIDDIQFLSGKEGTQEEFFHTFNALHQTNRQIVLTSDRMPQAIPGLEDRLSSRFIWGMVTDIKSPDLETRAAILRQKCHDRNVHLADDVTELLARTYQSNIRELEGALNQILVLTDLEQVEPNLEIVKQLIHNQQPMRSSTLSVNQIVQVIAQHYQVLASDLLGPRRHKEFVHPRQVMMYLLRHELNYSFPKIGRELGKDHTTIMHGVEKIERELPKNLQLQQQVTTLKDQLYHHVH